MVQAIEEVGGEVVCLDAKNNFRLISKYSQIIKFCRKENIDLIHCHLPWAGFVGRMVHKRTGIPVIYTEHNMQERYHVATRTINKFTFNSQSLALGVSEDVSRSIKKNIFLEIPVQTLLNGVNTKSFKRTKNSEIRKEFNIPEDAVVLGNVAVFRFQKRLIEWLQIFKKISQKNDKVFGIIVGAGPLEEKIKAEWIDLGLENKVFFAGLQTEVKPYFEAMDVFMMSSSFEGLPIALLEAMSMECAVVATEAGGIKEVIRSGKDGLTCPVNEWGQLVEKVQILLDEPENLKEYKQAARKRVIESFSLQRMVNELENLYETFSV